MSKPSTLAKPQNYNWDYKLSFGRSFGSNKPALSRAQCQMRLTTTHARCGVFYVVRRRSSSKRSYIIKPEVPLSLSTFSHFDNVRSCGTLLHRGFAGSEAWSPALEGSCWISSCPFTWVLHARCFWKEDCLKNRRIYVAVRRGQGPC